jgi:hypothetical protein
MRLAPMKNVATLLFLFSLSLSLHSQIYSSSSDGLLLSQISGVRVLESDSLDNLIYSRMKERNIKDDTGEDFPFVQFLNSDGTEYLKIYASPGNWYKEFFEVGKISPNSKLSRNLGHLNFKRFYSNDSLRLGMSNRDVIKILPLNDFRTFVHDGVLYYFKETGLCQDNDAFSTYKVVYLKFKNAKLIAYGFGYGRPYFNPLFPP